MSTMREDIIAALDKLICKDLPEGSVYDTDHLWANYISKVYLPVKDGCEVPPTQNRKLGVRLPLHRIELRTLYSIYLVKKFPEVEMAIILVWLDYTIERSWGTPGFEFFTNKISNVNSFDGQARYKVNSYLDAYRKQEPSGVGDVLYRHFQTMDDEFIACMKLNKPTPVVEFKPEPVTPPTLPPKQVKKPWWRFGF